MDRLNVVELRHSLADVLNRAEYRGERILIHRRGKDAAAIIPVEDLKLLERLIEEEEDRVDIAPPRPPWPSPPTGSPTRRSAGDWGSPMGKKRGGREAGPGPRRYEIRLTRAAERGLAALPKADLRRVDARILALADDPHPPGSQKLQGQETSTASGRETFASSTRSTTHGWSSWSWMSGTGAISTAPHDRRDPRHPRCDRILGALASGYGGRGGAARAGRQGWPGPSGWGVAAARPGPDRGGAGRRGGLDSRRRVWSPQGAGGRFSVCGPGRAAGGTPAGPLRSSRRAGGQAGRLLSLRESWRHAPRCRRP